MSVVPASSSGSSDPKPVHMIIKQRQQSRSGNFAPKEGAKSRGSNGNENLNPVLPPLFPPAPKCTPLSEGLTEDAKVYREFSNYFRSNYSVEGVGKTESGFYLPRYTDQYRSPAALKAHLLHKLPDSRYPEELTKTKVTKRTVERKMKRKIEDLPDADAEGEEKEETQREGSQSPQKAKPGTDDEEELEDEEKEENLDDDYNEEDADEEMDLGTDYAQSYFDNGEGDDDGDRGDDDDGPTYY